MSATSIVLTQAVGIGLLPPKVDTGTTGTGVDITDYDGVGVLTLLTGAAVGSGIINVLFEQSHDNSAWVACAHVGPTADGKSANTSGSNQTLTYTIDVGQTRRYLRASTTLVSGTSLIIGVALHAFKKYGV